MIPGVVEIPWRRKWQPTPVFLPWTSHRQRKPGQPQSVYGVAKKLDMTERLNHHLNILGWPKSSFGFFHTIYGEAQTKFLANPIIPMEDPGYMALVPQEANEGSEHTISEQDGKWRERKACKREHRTPTHQPHTSPDPWLSENKFGKWQ